jgi:hypothetical protein
VVARVKTTVCIEEGLWRAVQQAAAREGVPQYEVFENALRKHLGLDILDDLRARHSDLSDDEALRLAYDELHAYRTEPGTGEKAIGRSRG